MKKTILAITAVCGISVSALAAEVTAEITEVHVCCKGCVNGIEKAMAEVPGAKAAVDQEAGKVTLSGPDNATVQKAADALVGAGYFGKSQNSKIKVKSASGAKGEKVQTLTVEGVHLCCGKCVKAVDQAVTSVAGAKAHTATKGAKSFEVTGDFNDKEFFAALQKEGLAGKEPK